MALILAAVLEMRRAFGGFVARSFSAFQVLMREAFSEVVWPDVFNRVLKPSLPAV
jgi:hypothetical protein